MTETVIYDRDLLAEANEVFGEELQFVLAMEEMGELIQALSKLYRNQETFDGIIEEVVDVRLLMDQLAVTMEKEEQYAELLDMKAARLDQRVARRDINASGQ